MKSTISINHVFHLAAHRSITLNLLSQEDDYALQALFYIADEIEHDTTMVSRSYITFKITRDVDELELLQQIEDYFKSLM